MVDVAHLLDLLHKLQTFPKAERRTFLRQLDRTTKVFPQLIRLCLSQWVAAEQSGSLAPSEQSQLAIEETKAIATGTSDPNVCHIVAPIIWRHSPSSLIVATQVSGLFGWDEDFYTRLRSKFLHEEEGYGGITTLMTNMICLGRELEPGWSEGLFALEPLEPLDHDSSTMATLRLRVHWLSRTRFTSMASRMGKSFSTDPREVFVEENGQTISSRMIKHGSIIEISAKSQEQLPDRDLLRLRWLLMRLHALSGAPNPCIYPYDSNEMMKMLNQGGIYDDDHSEYYDEEE
ncbi:hypothetical protein CLIM01_09600 [Colletotrichum limetticola]|uniref:HNH nuclease domain-containing protein n=1 Tax=Colletotrichum limetticola TaxID=1209924 RepID=A0ABQ9PNC7_9PEZI|nr:hypothetical protein CLIM01_09600 [Colletotrichum limetticola]